MINFKESYKYSKETKTPPSAASNSSAKTFRAIILPDGFQSA